MTDKQPHATIMYDEPEAMTDAMRGAFARAFADPDFRSLLIHLAQRANADLLAKMGTGDVEAAKMLSTRYQTFNRMYELGQHYFTRAEKLKQELDSKKKITQG